MIRLVVAIAALVALSDVGQAQLLNQTGHGSVKQAAKVFPELAGKTTLQFRERSFYFTGGDEVAVFRLGDGDTLKLKFPTPLGWSLMALKEPAQPILIVVRRNDKEQISEIVRNSPLEKRLIELLQADLVDREHSPDDAQTITRLRDSLRSRKPSSEEKKGMEWLLRVYRDPSAAPPECREFLDAWRETLVSEPLHSAEPATNPDSNGEPSTPAR